MVMDRLGGFRLCRRLLDTEETLSPFLSAEAMVGRGGRAAGMETGRGDMSVSRGGRMEGGTGSLVLGQAAQTESNLHRVGPALTLGWVIARSISVFHLYSRPAEAGSFPAFHLIPLLVSLLQARTKLGKEHEGKGGRAAVSLATHWAGQGARAQLP